MKLRSLIVSGFVGFIILTTSYPKPSYAQGIPVIDVASIAQMVSQLTMLQNQFSNMQSNTRTPEQYMWANVQRSMNELIQLSNAINSIKNQYGGLNSALAIFRNYGYYRVSPCITGQALCNDAAWQEVLRGQIASTDIKKTTNDALARGIESQEHQIPLDANHLQVLQERTSTATGRMEAIQYANQLAAHQANQMLQLRQLMVAQYTAEEAKNQAENDKTAMQQAAKAEITQKLSPNVLPPGRVWTVKDGF